EMVRDAIDAVIDGDTAKAQKVIDTDSEVNEMQKLIDEQSTMILARRQPTASDLRLVLAIIKTVNDLERVGDEAESIARLAVSLADIDRPRGNYHELETMGNTVRNMLHDALDGFVRLQPQVAVELFQEDKKVDVEYENLLRQYYTFLVEEPRNTRRVLDCIWIARSLERIGDHAKNIGEYIVFLVEGKDLRGASFEERQRTITGGSSEES
ncbi:MAG: phosphate signaling complex protein PhoU, partial [Pseudomonadota bacterium]